MPGDGWAGQAGPGVCRGVGCRFSFWGYGGAVQSPDGAIWQVATSNKKDTGPATANNRDHGGRPWNRSGPGDVVHRQPGLTSHRRRRNPGERHHVPMQMRLVGIPTLGRDPGNVRPGHQPMHGVIEPNQPGSPLGWQPDLRPEPRPQPLPTPPHLTGQCVDPNRTTPTNDPRPGPSHLRIHEGTPRPPSQQQVDQREPFGPGRTLTQLSTNPRHRRTPQRLQVNHRGTQLGRGDTQQGTGTQRRQPDLQTSEIRGPSPSRTTGPGHQAPSMPPTRGIIDHRRTSPELQHQHDGRMRHHPQIDGMHPTILEPGHGHPGHPTGHSGPRDTPRHRVAAFVHEGPHHPMLTEHSSKPRP